MNDNPDFSRDKMTPAQRRLVEDEIKVYTPEEADARTKMLKEEQARKKQEQEQRRQAEEEKGKTNPSERQ